MKSLSKLISFCWFMFFAASSFAETLTGVASIVPDDTNFREGYGLDDFSERDGIINVLAFPQSYFNQAGSVVIGDQVEMLGQDGDWTNIRTDTGLEGWVKNSNVSSSELVPFGRWAIRETASDSVGLRASVGDRDADAGIFLKEGDFVELYYLYGRGNAFVKDTEGNAGWIDYHALEPIQNYDVSPLLQRVSSEITAIPHIGDVLSTTSERAYLEGNYGSSLPLGTLMTIVGLYDPNEGTYDIEFQNGEKGEISIIFVEVLTSSMAASNDSAGNESSYIVTEVPNYNYSSFIEVQVGDEVELVEITDSEYGLVQIKTSDGVIGGFQLDFLRREGAVSATRTPEIDGEPLFVCNYNADETAVMSQSNLTGREVARLENNTPVFVTDSLDNTDGTRVFAISFLDARGQNVMSGYVPNAPLRRECSIQGRVADIRGLFELEDGYCHFIVASRRTEIEAARYVDSESNFTPESHRIYQSQNGWYAISIGEVLETNFEALKAERDVPEDSFCTAGENFTETSPEFCQKSEINCEAGHDVSYGNCEVQAAINAINYLELSSSTVSDNGYVGVEGSFCGVPEGFSSEDLELTSFLGRGAEDHKYVFEGRTASEDFTITVDTLADNALFEWTTPAPAPVPNTSNNDGSFSDKLSDPRYTYCWGISDEDARHACLEEPWLTDNEDARKVLLGDCFGMSQQAQDYGLMQVCAYPGRNSCSSISNSDVAYSCYSCDGTRRWVATAAAGHVFECLN